MDKQFTPMQFTVSGLRGISERTIELHSRVDWAAVEAHMWRAAQSGARRR